MAIENFVRLAPQQVGLGLTVGRRLHLGTFGIWGFALLTSPTVGAAAETAVRFANLSFVIADITLRIDQSEARLEFDMSGLPPAIHRFVLERHCHVTKTFFRDFMKEEEFADFTIRSRLSDPGYADELSDLLKIRVEAGANCDAFVFPAAMLDQPLPKSDPLTQQYCIDQCKALLERTTGSLPSWSLKVRDALVERIGADPKIDQIAAQLNVTERTLRRRLKDEGTTYRHIYTDARLALAQQLLEQAGLTVETVSWRVGYAEPAAFVRAFSRKFGVTPGSVRASRQRF